MAEQDWDRLVADLRAVVDDIDRAVDAVPALAALADASRVPELYRLLRDDDFFVREAAAEPLARLEGVRALPQLFEALSRGEHEGHDNDGLVFTIVELLGAHPEEVRPLLLAMLRSPTPQERGHAAWALGFVPAEEALDPLLAALADQSPAVRGAAAGALGRYAADKVIDPLLQALQDGDAWVRVDVAATLGYLGDRRAVPALEAAQRDPVERVRFFATGALERLRRG